MCGYLFEFAQNPHPHTQIPHPHHKTLTRQTLSLLPSPLAVLLRVHIPHRYHATPLRRLQPERWIRLAFAAARDEDSATEGFAK